jgi:hypothetical protein
MEEGKMQQYLDEINFFSMNEMLGLNNKCKSTNVMAGLHLFRIKSIYRNVYYRFTHNFGKIVFHINTIEQKNITMINLIKDFKKKNDKRQVLLSFIFSFY